MFGGGESGHCAARRTLFALALLALGGARTAAALELAARERMVQSGRVGAEVIEALAALGHLRVMVAFELPGGQHAAALEAHARGAAIAETRASILAAVPAGAFVVHHTYDAVGAIAGDATVPGVLAFLDRPEVARIDVDAPGTAALTEALPIVRIADVEALGFTGSGVTVAVLDSGVDTNHPDLADAIVDQRCFCSGSGGCCPGGGATGTSAEDDNGHGTNVAGIITGNGTVAPEGGAPATHVVAIKVLAADGSFCCSSDVVAGLDYVITNHPEVRVVNASLGTSQLFSGACDNASAFVMAFASAIDTLRARGTLTFVSSGNQGSSTQIAAPACVANAIAVGATWDAPLGSETFLGCTDTTTAVDEVTCFTNSDSQLDLVAEGAYITATGLGGGTSTYGGTSQASPMTAACAADLLQAQPSATASEIEAALKASPTVVTDAKNGLQFTRLDCLASLNALGVTTSTTTTTTLACPPSGAAGALCMLGNYPPSACASEAIPKAIGRRVALARAALVQAESATSARRARRLLAKARGSLKAADKLARKTDRKHKVNPACGLALDLLLTDAAGRAH